MLGFFQVKSNDGQLGNYIPPPPPLPRQFQSGYIPPPPPLPDKFKNPPPEDDWIKKTFGNVDKSVLMLGGLALVLVLTKK